MFFKNESLPIVPLTCLFLFLIQFLPLVSSGQVGGVVFRDYNGNGVKDTTELLGVSGVLIKAFDKSGNPLGSTLSDQNGQWGFPLAPIHARFFIGWDGRAWGFGDF